MKTHFAIISLLAVASLVLLVVAFAAGVSSPSWTVISRIAGCSWACGALAIFLTDYAPRRSYAVPAAVRAPAAKRQAVPAARAAVRPSSLAPATGRPVEVPAAVGAAATLGWANHPATVSLS